MTNTPPETAAEGKNLPSNKPVAVTKDGSEIFIVDDLHPEATAMAQALYSRSPQSVVNHLDKIAEVGWLKFMDTYYVGYGHKSIGDCGSTTLFAENISLLAAKAIQDWPLYKGQEASTRYIDMAKQKVLNPLGTPEGERIQKVWMDLYNKSIEVLVPYLKEKYPRHDSEKEAVYDKAIKAKAFDMSRGFLPAGVTTYASWHTDLRQAYDHIKHLEHHPLEEIRELGTAIRNGLREKYPSSFSHKTYDEQEAYYDLAAKISYYDRESNALEEGFKARPQLDLNGLMKHRELLEKRPVKTELPGKLAKYGSITFSFPLDFGSFRDLQRHRNGVCEMPLLTVRHGFLPWYLEQMPEGFRQEAKKVIDDQAEAIKKLQCADAVRQYYVAIGFVVACEVTYSVPQTIYVAELRAGQMVHSTLRVVAQQMADILKSLIPGIAIHADMSADEWDTKRGTQDIVKKENVAIGV